jgi:hypothetical protein
MNSLGDRDGDQTKEIKGVPEKWLRAKGTVARSTNVKHLPLGGVFSACKVHRIPVFQRRYCWTERQWQRMWDSVKEVKDDAQSCNHSMGRLMLLHRGDGSRLVLDGQQRLTTLTLLLSALRDRRKAQSEASDDLEELKEICKPERLLPTLDDREDFQRCLTTAEPSGDGPLPGAKRFFSRLSQELDAQACEDMAMAVLQRVFLTTFVIDNEESVQAVFENLAQKEKQRQEANNDVYSCIECYTEGEGGRQVRSTHFGPCGERICEAHANERPGSTPMNTGVPMSPLDLIRNFVFDHYESEQLMREIHEKYWSPIETKYEPEKLENALKHFLDKQGYSTAQRWGVYTAFMDWWHVDESEDSELDNIEAHATEKMAMLEMSL